MNGFSSHKYTIKNNGFLKKRKHRIYCKNAKKGRNILNRQMEGSEVVESNK